MTILECVPLSDHEVDGEALSPCDCRRAVEAPLDQLKKRIGGGERS